MLFGALICTVFLKLIMLYNVLSLPVEFLEQEIYISTFICMSCDDERNIQCTVKPNLKTHMCAVFARSPLHLAIGADVVRTLLRAGAHAGVSEVRLQGAGGCLRCLVC